MTVLGKEIRIHTLDTGDGIQILIEGGDRSHIGAVAAACLGECTMVTSFPGHREEIICRRWAEAVSTVYRGPVIVSAG